MLEYPMAGKRMNSLMSMVTLYIHCINIGLNQTKPRFIIYVFINLVYFNSHLFMFTNARSLETDVRFTVTITKTKPPKIPERILYTARRGDCKNQNKQVNDLKITTTD